MPAAPPQKERDVGPDLMQVGLLSAQWAYLENLYASAIWYFLDVLDNHNDGRLITGPFGAEKLAQLVKGLAHRKLGDPADLEIIERVTAPIKQLADERNLAVKGLREVRPDETVVAHATRGDYKNRPQKMSSIRLQSLNNQVSDMIDELEALLVKHGVREV